MLTETVITKPWLLTRRKKKMRGDAARQNPGVIAETRRRPL
jgi:hypothetical protein